MTLPLKSLRVLDLSRVLAGPLATMILGDLGADVVKIERAGRGDDSRDWGPPFDSRGESAYFLCCNRNKLSVAVDFRDAGDLALLRTLIAEADVVVENFRSGTLARWQLDPAVLLAAHSRLIWCTITGFGGGSARPGYDFVVQAESGWMSVTGEPSGAPMKSGVALVDVITGKDAAIAILAALAGVRGGAAADRNLSVSLRQSAVGALINVAQSALVTGQDAGRWGNAHASLVPYELFDASDRAIVVAVGSDAQFEGLVRAMDLPLLRDPRFVTNAGRVTHRAEVVASVRERAATRPAVHWLETLGKAGVPCGVVRSVLEALGDVGGSALTGVAPDAPGEVRRPPPRLDEHGAAVRAHGWKAFART